MPVPVPFLSTVIAFVPSTQFAVAVVFAVIVTSHVPLPLQPTGAVHPLKIEPLAGADAEMVLAPGTHVAIPLHIDLIDDLLAILALDPEPLGDIDLPLSDSGVRPTLALSSYGDRLNVTRISRICQGRRATFSLGRYRRVGGTIVANFTR